MRPRKSKDNAGEGSRSRAASPDLVIPRRSPSPSFSHGAASPTAASNLLQELERSGYQHQMQQQQQQASASSRSSSPPPPLPPIRIRTNPSPAPSPAASPLGSPSASPRAAALQLLGEGSGAASPDHAGGRRLLFLPKKHGKKASCAGRVEDTGIAPEPPRPQLRDRLVSQPLHPSGALVHMAPMAPMPMLGSDDTGGSDATHFHDGGFHSHHHSHHGSYSYAGSSAPGSGTVSAAGSRSVSRASSSSFLGALGNQPAPHAAGPASLSPTGGGADGAFDAAGADVKLPAGLSEFALAEPTPRVPGEPGGLLGGEDPLMMAPPRETPVRYGAVIRLWVSGAEEEDDGHGNGNGGGGFLGFAARDARRLQGQLPQSGRFNVGMNDTFFVLPPYKPGLGWHVRETYFRVEDPKGQHRDGEPIRYGEELLLVDEEEMIMCHFRGRRYIRRKPKGTKGEMTVAFLPQRGTARQAGQEVHYGDAGIRLRLQTRKGLRTEGVVLSALKRESIDAVGGFLNCLGRGRELTFDIEHAPPRIHDVSITSSLVHRQRVYVSRTTHHRVHWGQQLVFAAPSCQGHAAADHEGCTIRVTLSNGARLKMRQEHLDGLADRVRGQQGQQGQGKPTTGEVWLPTKGIPGEDVDLLVRLVPLDTTPLDPRRVFEAGGGAGSGEQQLHAAGRRGLGGGGKGLGWLWLLEAPLLLMEGLRELLPLGPLAVYALASLALDAAGRGGARAREMGEVHALGRTLLLLLASALAYLGVLHFLQGSLALLRWLLPSRVRRALLGSPAPGSATRPSASSPTAGGATISSGLPSPTTMSELPPSMLFDRWELVVLDWRVPPGAADGDALAGSYRTPPPPPPPVPPTFVEAEKGDADKARARWERTLAWRREQEVDQALQRPHPKFRLFKRLYPQAFHFRDREGHVVFYELLGRLQVQALLKAGVGLADLTEHIVLQQEFLWRVLQPKEEDRVLLVMDLKGVSFADVTAEVINFAKAAVGLTSTHYPARSFRTLIVNTPSWFSIVFRILRPMLNEDTRRKIVFLEESAVRDGAMLDFIAPEFLPKEYGGACEVPLGESPFEKQLLEIVETGLEEHEMTWLDKDPPLPAQQSQRAAAGAATIGAMAEAGEEDEE